MNKYLINDKIKTLIDFFPHTLMCITMTFADINPVVTTEVTLTTVLEGFAGGMEVVDVMAEVVVVVVTGETTTRAIVIAMAVVAATKDGTMYRNTRYTKNPREELSVCACVILCNLV